MRWNVAGTLVCVWALVGCIDKSPSIKRVTDSAKASAEALCVTTCAPEDAAKLSADYTQLTKDWVDWPRGIFEQSSDEKRMWAGARLAQQQAALRVLALQPYGSGKWLDDVLIPKDSGWALDYQTLCHETSVIASCAAERQEFNKLTGPVLDNVLGPYRLADMAGNPLFMVKHPRLAVKIARDFLTPVTGRNYARALQWAQWLVLAGQPLPGYRLQGEVLVLTQRWPEAYEALLKFERIAQEAPPEANVYGVNAEVRVVEKVLSAAEIDRIQQKVAKAWDPAAKTFEPAVVPKKETIEPAKETTL